MSCSSCGPGGPFFGNFGCCPTCSPANVALRGECQDPGTLTSLRYLSGLDYQFCAGRLTNGAGILNNVINGSGNSVITWTNTPKLDPETVTAAEDTPFGALLVLGSDNRLRQLEPPAGSGLTIQTDGSSNLIFAAIPAATVPDPLNVNDLTVANAATINDLETNGTVEMNNIASGTPVALLGLNASNVLVTQSIAAGLAASMFYENSTSPGVTAPNESKVNGDTLIIGNRLYDSGANLISVTTSESITVNVAGKYLIGWTGLVRIGNSNGKATIPLLINGVTVNVGNGRTTTVLNSLGQTYCNITGVELRTLAAGDVIQLSLSATVTVTTYEARLVALKFAD